MLITILAIAFVFALIMAGREGILASASGASVADARATGLFAFVFFGIIALFVMLGLWAFGAILFGLSA